MGADALLAAAHQMERLQPLVQGDMAALHHRSHRDGEILAAFLLRTAEHAKAFGGIGVVDHAAMRTHRTGGPQYRL